MAGAKSAGYKLATYKSSDGPRAGMIVGDEVFDAAKLTGKAAYATVMGILADWKAAEAGAEEGGSRRRQKPGQAPAAVQNQAAGPAALPFGDLLRRRQLRRPCRRNGGQGGQSAATRSAYAGPQGLAFSQGRARHHRSGRDGENFRLCQKHGLGDRDWPPSSAGRPRTSRSRRRSSYVAGYTIANDLSARDRGRRAGVPDASPFKWDWTKHKTFEGSCPLGPWIVPASDIGDPQKLGLKLWVNGVLKQDSNTSDMIFNLAEQIEQFSAGMTLHPGDLILTGTPAGVGAGRGEFLKAGDVVKLWVEKIGEIENRMA